MTMPLSSTRSSTSASPLGRGARFTDCAATVMTCPSCVQLGQVDPRSLRATGGVGRYTALLWAESSRLPIGIGRPACVISVPFRLGPSSTVSGCPREAADAFESGQVRICVEVEAVRAHHAGRGRHALQLDHVHQDGPALLGRPHPGYPLRCLSTERDELPHASLNYVADTVGGRPRSAVALFGHGRHHPSFCLIRPIWNPTRRR